MADPVSKPRFLASGDGGLTVEFGDAIDEDTNRAVLALADALEAASLPGLVETVPTYRSLLVLFDPVTLPRRRLIAAIEGLWPPAGGSTHEDALWRVPVCYGGVHGADLATVADLHGISQDEVVRLHSGALYRVYMVGFAPGFSYLGGLPPSLHTARRQDPRLRTPPRSISIGGRQAAVAPPLPIPSGWHLLGQTPVRSYDPRRAERPFLFAPGDLIGFAPVDETDYEAMCAAADAGETVATREGLR